jgi:beta-glucosidase
LASSFDIDLIQKVGEKIGKEARKIGCHFWISPGLNLHRNPLYGEYFQSFSEDPILTGKMAASLTKGLQSKRVSIVLNNFAFNNKVKNSNGEYSNTRLSIDSRMAERVAREIYLKGFEIAIKEGNPWSIMTSNNRINNMKTAESYDLLTYILRNEWNYEGFVMSGWYSWSHHDREAHA